MEIKGIKRTILNMIAMKPRTAVEIHRDMMAEYQYGYLSLQMNTLERFGYLRKKRFGKSVYYYITSFGAEELERWKQQSIKAAKAAEEQMNGSS